MSEGMLFNSDFTCVIQVTPVHSAARGVHMLVCVCDTPAVAHELVCQWSACVSTHKYYTSSWTASSL